MDNSDGILSSFTLAQYCNKQGDYEQTRLYLEAVLDQNNPNDEYARQLYWEYSLCLYKLGECSDALANIEQGLAHYPDCREMYYIKGLIYYDMGLMGYSRDSFTKYLNIKKSFLVCEDGVAVDYKAFAYLTVIAFREEKYEDSIYYLTQCILQKADISIINKLYSLLKSGINKHTLIEHLVESNVISEPVLVLLLLKNEEYKACRDFIKGLGKESEFKLEWIQCQLYLGRYEEVQHDIETLIPAGTDILIYYCISRWLETPRRDAREFLLKLDGTLAEVQTCLWIEELIFNNASAPIQTTAMKNDHMIKKIALIIYTLGDICLALDVMQNYFCFNRKRAYAELGREALDREFLNEARVLLERGLSHEDENAEDYYRLGVVCGGFGLYGHALEYFLRAAALNPEKQVYPCLAYEALVINEIEILVKKLELFIENPKLITELLRLCSLRYKSRRLRQRIEKSGNDGKETVNIYKHFDRWSLINETDEEAVWKAND